ncbi:MAG TPA: response regulator [candidate division Zixibacteria bacterium]|nr:response regulator [candidate division Zixibacteria bacterium]
MGTIILVDDDRSNTTLLKMLLEMDGFQVSACPGMVQALDAANDSVDAFIIDCNLAQGEDGIELLQAIRNGSTNAPQDCPVIVTSGDDGRIEEAELAGATTFLLKPFSPSSLSDLLRSVLVR